MNRRRRGVGSCLAGIAAVAALAAPSAGAASTTGYVSCLAALPGSRVAHEDAAKSPAKKCKFTNYDVEYQGSGTFSALDVSGSTTSRQTASFRWDTSWPAVAVIEETNGHLVIPGTSVASLPPGVKVPGEKVTPPSGSGTWSTSVSGSEDEDCQQSGGLTLSPIAGLTFSLDPKSPKTIDLKLDAGSDPEFTTTGGSEDGSGCETTNFFGDWIANGPAKVGYPPASAADQTIETPLQAMAKGLTFGHSLTQHVSADALQARSGDDGCGNVDGEVCTASFSYSATITADPECDPDFNAQSRAAVHAAKVCKPVTAKLKQPSAVTRTHTVTLDASGSKPSKAIKRYEFEFSPGSDCPKGTKLTHTTEKSDNDGKSPKLKIKLLCSLDVKVKVTDKDGNTDTSDPVTVSVKARTGKDWKIKRQHEQYTNHQDHDFQQPTGYLSPKSTPANPVVTVPPTNWGESFSGPDFRHTDVSGILMPYEHSSWDGHGYELAMLDDNGGPFDNFTYVESSSLSVDRQECLNPYLLASAPPPAGAKQNWYSFNASKGIDVQAIIAATQAHEGLGTATSTGHTKTIFDMLAANDPRKAIEDAIGPSKLDARSMADTTLQKIEVTLLKATTDATTEDSGTINGVTATSYTSSYWVWVQDLDSWEQASPFPF